jgi:hypothetical protein
VKADPWILNDLPEFLVDDWYDLQLYSEFDAQVATYYHLRRHFQKERARRSRR